MIDLKDKRLLFFDFDGTLVETKSGNTFPTDLTDMVLKMDVLNRIVDLVVENDVKAIGICSNQGGVELGYVDFTAIHAKILYVGACIDDLVKHRRETKKGVFYNLSICPHNDKSNSNRKPNPGMLEQMVFWFKNAGYDFDKSQMLMVGDASGFEGQFSDSDLKCAENFGIDYMDVVDFVGKDLCQDIILKPTELKRGCAELIPEERKVVIGRNPYSVKRIVDIYLKGYEGLDMPFSVPKAKIMQDPYAGKAEYVFPQDLVETGVF